MRSKQSSYKNGKLKKFLSYTCLVTMLAGSLQLGLPASAYAADQSAVTASSEAVSSESDKSVTDNNSATPGSENALAENILSENPAITSGNAADERAKDSDQAVTKESEQSAADSSQQVVTENSEQGAAQDSQQAATEDSEQAETGDSQQAAGESDAQDTENSLQGETTEQPDSVVTSKDGVSADSYPEFYTSASADNGVDVEARAESGILPKGTEMRVTPISSDSNSKKADALQSAIEDELDDSVVVDFIAVDISFIYKGKEIEPDGDVSIKLETSHKIEGDAAVWHVDDSMEATCVDDAEVSETMPAFLRTVFLYMRL